MSTRYRATIYKEGTLVDQLYDDHIQDILARVSVLYDSGRVIIHTVMRTADNKWQVVETNRDFYLDNLPSPIL